VSLGLELILEVSFFTLFKKFNHEKVVVYAGKGSLAEDVPDLEVGSEFY